MKDSEDRSKLIEAIRNREALLDAVSFSAGVLLSTPDWASKMNTILHRLGEVSHSSRVYVFQHKKRDDGTLLSDLIFEWCAEGVDPQIQNEELQNMDVEASGFERWIKVMNAGGLIHGLVDSFPKGEKEFLKSQDIKSIVVIPFFVQGLWWGFIGFDQCDRERDWSPAELDALQALANMIGSAIERQLAEKKLREQFEELQKTNHELDLFVYSVSHDLRAPLASILGLVNLAEMENPEEKQLQYLQLIRKSIKRFDDFAKDIIDFSENARVKIKPEKINFEKMIKASAAHLFPPDLKEKIRLEVSCPTKEVLYSDKKRIAVIINNLMANAIKFCDKQKDEVAIKVDIKVMEGFAEITFQDNGIGIEQQYLNKVFNMFFRASEQSDGSGLGLYITREIIHKLGGKISLESEIGAWTRFKIKIPNLKKLK